MLAAEDWPALPSGDEWEDRRALGGAEGQVFRGGSGLCPQHPRYTYSRSMTRQATSSSSAMMLADLTSSLRTNRKVNFLGRSQISTFTRESATGGKCHPLNLPKTMPVWTSQFVLHSFSRHECEMGPNRGYVHKAPRGGATCTGNMKGSVSEAGNGISFCALCPPKHNSSPLIKQELLIDEQQKLKWTDQRTFWEKHWSN